MMKTFSSRLIGAATGHVPAATTSSSYASDLVQRTLARHGLAADTTAVSPGKASGQGLPSSLFDRLSFKAAMPGAAAPLPDGATFTEDRFSCVEGERRFLTYVPATATEGVRGLIVMLHGCTQTPEDFAAGTRMNDLAEEHRLIIVYPHQSRGENAQSCWNWFRRGDQRRARGEPAILAGLAENVALQHGVPEGKTYVAGLSAGGAMAAILGEAYPEVFSAVGVHSGLPVGSAKDVGSAFAAMSGNPMPRASAEKAVVARTIVIHGTADTTVHPGNGEEIVRQVLGQGPQEMVLTEDRGSAGRNYSRQVFLDSAGVALVEHWKIDGLGHAWSGGSEAGTYTDRSGPDASSEMIRFFLE